MRHEAALRGTSLWPQAEGVLGPSVARQDTLPRPLLLPKAFLVLSLFPLFVLGQRVDTGRRHLEAWAGNGKTQALCFT